MKKLFNIFKIFLTKVPEFSLILDLGYKAEGYTREHGW